MMHGQKNIKVNLDEKLKWFIFIIFYLLLIKQSNIIIYLSITKTLNHNQM